MNAKLWIKYSEKFNCVISYAFQVGHKVLCDNDGKIYSLLGINDDELNVLMQESINTDENILLKNVADKPVIFTPRPNCDY